MVTFALIIAGICIIALLKMYSWTKQAENEKKVKETSERELRQKEQRQKEMSIEKKWNEKHLNRFNDLNNSNILSKNSISQLAKEYEERLELGLFDLAKETFEVLKKIDYSCFYKNGTYDINNKYTNKYNFYISLNYDVTREFSKIINYNIVIVDDNFFEFVVTETKRQYNQIPHEKLNLKTFLKGYLDGLKSKYLLVIYLRSRLNKSQIEDTQFFCDPFFMNIKTFFKDKGFNEEVVFRKILKILIIQSNKINIVCDLPFMKTTFEKLEKFDGIRIEDYYDSIHYIRQEPSWLNKDLKWFRGSDFFANATGFLEIGYNTIKYKKAYEKDKIQQWLDENNIKYIYHFTDKSNIDSIIAKGGLYSWEFCNKNNIDIPICASNTLSQTLDKNAGLNNYVRCSFIERHPMVYAAKNEGRIKTPVLLLINPEVCLFEQTKFSTFNATKNQTIIGNDFNSINNIQIETIKKYNDVYKTQKIEENDLAQIQAEILILEHIPLKYILNIFDPYRI